MVKVGIARVDGTDHLPEESFGLIQVKIDVKRAFDPMVLTVQLSSHRVDHFRGFGLREKSLNHIGCDEVISGPKALDLRVLASSLLDSRVQVLQREAAE